MTLEPLVGGRNGEFLTSFFPLPPWEAKTLVLPEKGFSISSDTLMLLLRGVLWAVGKRNWYSELRPCLLIALCPL